MRDQSLSVRCVMRPLQPLGRLPSSGRSPLPCPGSHGSGGPSRFPDAGASSVAAATSVASDWVRPLAAAMGASRGKGLKAAASYRGLPSGRLVPHSRTLNRKGRAAAVPATPRHAAPRDARPMHEKNCDFPASRGLGRSGVPWRRAGVSIWESSLSVRSNRAYSHRCQLALCSRGGCWHQTAS